MAAGCVGTARKALEHTVAHVCTRKQFGRSLADLAVVRQQLASMATRLWIMEAVVGHAAHHPDELFPSLAAKVLCSDGAWATFVQAIQLHGGTGFIEETGLPLLLRDTRVTRIFEGANDVLLTHAGRALLLDGRDTPPPPGTQQVWETVAEVREAMVRRHRLKLLRRHVDLHHLGRLAVLRTSVVAGAAAPPSPTHFRRWCAAVNEEAMALTRALYRDESTDRDTEDIVEQLLEEMAP